MSHNLRKLRLTFWDSAVFNLFITCSLLVLSAQLSWCQDACSSGPCYPTPTDIAGKFNVTANSTCGDPAEVFCMNLQCIYVCNEGDPGLRHNVSFITDNIADTFWKSKNFEYPVVVQLDIGRTFMLYRSIVTFHHQLPAAMYILKSNDSGLTYRPISFFATDCMEYFNMNETHENDIEGLKVQCFKIESNNPSKQLYYSPMQDENTAMDLLTDSEKQAFFLMTNLRLVLVKFITRDGFNPDTISESFKQQYFFSISDWDILASCFCNGQASECDADDPSKCICERNTEGYNCEQCLPLFNNKPYRIREACEDCGCNNHSDSCTYSEAKGYGVCDSCQHNTVGDKCDKCRATYYKNPDVTFSHITACLACACNVSGVNSSANSSVCHNETGQCECKSNVIGRACDTCHDEFWNLDASSEQGCEGCECNVTGTVNASNVCNKITGQCPCTALRAGRTCNTCKDGFFGLTSQNPGCSDCNCNPAGSVNDTCNLAGQCFCRPRFFGYKCENIEQGFFLPSVDYMTHEAEDAFIPRPQEMKIKHTTITNSKGASVLVVGVVLNEGDSDASSPSLSFVINIPKTGFFSFILRYLTMHQWKLIKITALLRSNFTPFSCNGGVEVTQNEPYIMIANISSSKEALNFGSHCVSVGQYKVDLEIPFGSAVPAVVTRRKRRETVEQEIIVDSLVVMPTVARYEAFQAASSLTQENMTFYYNQSFSLRTWSASSQAGNVALSPVFGEIFVEGKACNCSTVGSNNHTKCEQYGGSCSCRANVIGQACEKCRPDYFNFTSGQGCQACDCNMIGANQTSCHNTTGQCSCRQNVIGLHCDRCESYYYGFSSGEGCSPCNCDSTYSTDLQCNGSSGVCNCKPGINGGKCTGCQNGYYNLTAVGCMPCQCNSAGSTGLVCNKTTGQCPCKTQSIGRTCAECPAGHYGLSVNNPDGCLECHCSNKSSICAVAADWFVSMINTSLYTNQNNVGTDGWSAVDGEGSSLNLTELDWTKWIELAVKASIRVETSSSQEIYFSAPSKYLGDKRFAYTYSVSFYLLQEDASSPANSSRGDVILRGKWFDQPLVTTLNPPPPDGDDFERYEVRFVEKDWRVGNTSGRQPTSYEMIVVLSELTSLHIRAKWTTLNTVKNSWIGDISMTISDKETVATQEEKAMNVENCTCPVEYDGQFCEQCASGYTRIPPSGGPYVAICVPCMCNGHSNTCNPDTGVCYKCQHNTTGDHCEKCADGWYGDATNGTAEDCKPCPCPGGPSAANQFAETCKVDNDGQPTCVNCSRGHEGRNCESCMDGYFGRPMKHDGSCQLCNCSGNIDRSSRGNCNTTSGECLKCLYNTTGFDCEWCAAGFHGNALNQTCTECTCSAVGATSNNCNNVSGTCDCQPYVTGPLCDKCEQRAFNFTSSGCLPCNCDRDGSTDLQCDLTLGNCSCHSNVMGTKCDMCAAGFFDVTQRCQDCDCIVNQTVANTTCDPNSGQCECRVSMAGGKYGGRQCQTCALHTVGSPPSCYPCTEQCFRNWFSAIANESTKVNQLDAEVTALLESFGSMPVDHINLTLQELHRNVSYANRIFQSGGREDLEKRRDQIEQIQSSISELQQELNQSKELIADAQTYLEEQVVNFNGSVRIIPATAVTYPSFPVVCPSGGGVSVIVDWQCIEKMALSYQQRALQANESGYANYSSILSSYNMIQQANLVASRAASQISDALDSLQMISNVREQIESDLGPSFLNLYQNHSIRLEEIRRITETLQNLLSVATNVGEQATRKVEDAEQLVTGAQTLATQRKREARTAFENATNAHTDALGAHTAAEITLNVASQFKRNATMVLNQTREALQNVTAGRDTIARVNNMTLEAVNIADEVKGMNMPVSLEDIQNLATEILNTTVNETLVNHTLQEAEKSLEQAKEVESLSERAVNVSRQTLDTVEDIEKTMEMSSQYRQEAVELQQQTDDMIASVNNITETVQQRFSAAYSSGQSLLTEINSTIDNLEGSILCFDTAKGEAESASEIARTAYNVSKEAKEIFDNSSVSLPPAAGLINSSYEEANRSLAEVEQAHQDAEQLLKDVTEAEVLLEQYILQRTELEKLSHEIQQLDAEADYLLTQYSVAAEQYGQCTGA